MSLKAIPGSLRRARDEPAETVLKAREETVVERGELKRKLDLVDTVTRPVLALELSSYPEDADEDDEEDEEEDEEEEMLIRELTRIKQERADEELKRQAREAAKEAAVQESNAVSSNPLFSSSVPRRRWDDDTVFHAQNIGERKQKKFVNDVVRSDFHNKFLAKYIH